MISPEIIHVNYIKKEAQTIWPEPFCFVKTPAEQKTTKQFPLTQEGCLEAVAWLNEQHKSRSW